MTTQPPIFNCSTDSNTSTRISELKSKSYAKLGVRFVKASSRKYDLVPLDKLVTGDLVFKLGNFVLFINPELYQDLPCSFMVQADAKKSEGFIIKKSRINLSIPKKKKIA